MTYSRPVSLAHFSTRWSRLTLRSQRTTRGQFHHGLPLTMPSGSGKGTASLTPRLRHCRTAMGLTPQRSAMSSTPTGSHAMGYIMRCNAERYKKPLTAVAASATVEHMRTYRCPDTIQEPTEADPLVGCGLNFDGEPDDEGLVDCPRCGLWFHPTAPENHPQPSLLYGIIRKWAARTPAPSHQGSK